MPNPPSWTSLISTNSSTLRPRIGANPTILRDAEQLKQRRALREAQLAQLQASATAATAIDSAKTLSKLIQVAA